MYRLPKSTVLGSHAERAWENCAAIRVAKTIERESRAATDAERDALARYTGWGDTLTRCRAVDVTDVRFRRPYSLRGDFRVLYEEGLLSDEEVDAVKASTLNAHYTPHEVVYAVWDALGHLGIGRVARPNVLEPSCGSGRFLGAAPEDCGLLVGVERDPLTALVARALYPEADVRASPFESVDLPPVFDVVVGNVPFGKYPVHDPDWDASLRGSVHNYFLTRSLSLLRPGGVMAVVTSRYTLDAEDDRARRWLASRGELLGAVRLPSDAFRDSAGTHVVADVLFVRRREHPVPGAEPWTGRETVRYPVSPPWCRVASRPACEHEDCRYESGLVSAYYAAYPHMALGVWAHDKLAMGRTGAVGLETPEDEARGLGERFAVAAAHLPAGALTPRGEDPRSAQEAAPVPPPTSGPSAVRLAATRILRALRGLLDAERRSGDCPEVDRARAALRSAHDAWVKRYGSLAAAESSGAARDVASESWWPLLRSIEDPDGSRGPVFTRRTVASQERAPATDPVGALYQILDETGSFTPEAVAARCGADPSEVAAALRGVAYQEGPGGRWVTRAEFLSGNIRAKIRDARRWAALDPSFSAHVADLEEALPAPVPPADVSVPFGAPWVPGHFYADFLRHLFPGWDGRDGARVEYVPETGDWLVSVRASGILGSVEARRYGTPRAPFADILRCALRLKVPVVYDPTESGTRVRNDEETARAGERLAELRRQWDAWVMAEPERARSIADAYNERFGGWREREWDGSHLTFPGIAASYKGKPLELRRHQKAGALRIVERGTPDDSVLVTYQVGLGKTATLICGVETRLRLGLTRKAVVVVPGHTLAQWEREWALFFPGSSEYVLAATDGAFSDRRRFLARACTGNARVILMTYEQCRSIPMRPETIEAYVKREVLELEDALVRRAEGSGERRVLEREMKKRQRTLEAFRVRARERWDKLSRAADAPVSWEDVGADLVAWDECHYLKNAPVESRMSGVAGLSRGEGSARAVDGVMKTHYVTCPELFPGLPPRRPGKAVGLTGTPLTNTLAEAWVMMRLFQPRTLRGLGLWHFDDWARTFTVPVSDAEFDAVGELRLVTRLKFHNVQELLTILGQTWERAHSDVERPRLVGGRMRVVEVPGSEELREFNAELADRAADVRARRVPPDVDNMLKITHEGRLASLHNGRPRGRWAPTCVTPVDACVDQAIDLYCHTDRKRGLQLIFCDMHTPKAASDDEGDASATPEEVFADQGVYGVIRDKLHARGVMEGEVAYIHDATTDEAKRRLFADANAGRIRILIGSTQMMGTGVNVQERAIACHHLTVPWRPDWLEQAEGRVRRPGNSYDEVYTFCYPTIGSYAVVLWQFIEVKGRFIASIVSRTYQGRTADDIGDVVVDAATAKAIALGNLAVIAKTKLEMRLPALTRSHSAWVSDRRAAAAEIDSLPRRLADLEETAAAAERAVGVRDANPNRAAGGTGGFCVNLLDGKMAAPEPIASIAVARARLEWIADNFGRTRRASMPVGSYRGFDLSLVRTAQGSTALRVSAGGWVWEVWSFRTSDAFVVLENKLARLEADAAASRAAAESARSRAAALAREVAWTERETARSVLAEYLAACRDAASDGVVQAQVPPWATLFPDVLADHEERVAAISAAAAETRALTAAAGEEEVGVEALDEGDDSE